MYDDLTMGTRKATMAQLFVARDVNLAYLRFWPIRPEDDDEDFISIDARDMVQVLPGEVVITVDPVVRRNKPVQFISPGGRMLRSLSGTLFRRVFAPADGTI